MPKPNFQAIVISRVINAAPHLRFVAFYHADETRVNACMHGYEGRAFVYVLTTVFEDTEHFLYVGKSKAQYSRFLMHLKAYAFQHIYLFECDLEHQGESEVATIKELKPLYNRHHNCVIYFLCEINTFSISCRSFHLLLIVQCGYKI